MKILGTWFGRAALTAGLALTPIVAGAASSSSAQIAPLSAARAVTPGSLSVRRLDTKGGAMARVDANLQSLAQQARSGALSSAGLAAVQAQNRAVHLRRAGTTAMPLVLVDATARSNVNALRASLELLGLKGASSFGNSLSGWLPANAVSAAGALSELRSLRASQMQKHAGAALSQGDFAQRSGLLRTNTGLTGAGIKVGVLSDSFDCQGGAAAGVASGDLPAAGVQVLKDETDCLSGSDEGRAMAEIIHDVAPGADIAFYTAFDGEADFAAGIIALADAGARVIVDDVGYFDEPVFQDGIVGQAVNAVRARGVSYFSSAGNNGRTSYESGFTPGGAETLGGFTSNLNDFDPGPAVNTVLPLTLPPQSSTFIILQWDQPTASAGGAGSASDVDICLTFADGTEIDPSLCGVDDNVFTGNPVEIFGIHYNGTNPISVGLKVGLFGGSVPGLIKVIFSTNGQAPDGSIGGPFATNSGTIQGHPQALGAAAVGAAFFRDTPACGTDPAVKESFSSAGGTATLFAVNGSRLASAVVRRKPDFVAPDGGNTSFFGDDASAGLAGIPAECRDDDTDQGNFFGTSAAAPHAAGIAALLLQQRPHLLPSQVIKTLADTTSEMLTPGFDFDTGTGFVRAETASAVAAGIAVNAQLNTPVISGAVSSSTPVAEGPMGSYRFDAQVCARSGSASLNGVFARTLQLTNGNSLISRTGAAPSGAAGGPGSTQNFASTGGYADGVLSASECTVQQYRIGLASRARFTFTVDFLGNVIP